MCANYKRKRPDRVAIEGEKEFGATRRRKTASCQQLRHEHEQQEEDENGAKNLQEARRNPSVCEEAAVGELGRTLSMSLRFDETLA